MYKLLGLDEEGRKAFNRAVIACVLTNLSLLLSFAAILQIITLLLEPLAVGSALDATKLWIYFGLALGAALVYFLAYSNEYDKTYTAAYNESEKIRVEVAERLRKLPLSFFNNKDLSELTTNIMGDCTTIEHVMSHVAPELVAHILTAALTCLLLGFYDWRMAAALFAALPVSIALVVLSKGIQRKFGERFVAVKLDAAERSQEYLEGIKVVKAFGLAGEKFEALKVSLNRMMRAAMKFEVICGIFLLTASLVLQTGVGLVVFVGVTLLAGGALDAVKLFFFTLISVKIYSSLIVVFTLLPELFFLFISTRRMQALRREPVAAGEERVELSDYNIELRNVSFAYRDELVVKNVTLSIPQNGVTALVGPSGSGKTTILRLIARFWDVKDGEILIGRKDVRAVAPETLLRYLSVVFQDVVLFNDTIMNNIRIGKQGASDDEVYRAAKLAHCDEFIRATPHGYETIIGENGSTLSGGERQRISIARALLKDAPIVLLDEATASLDPENEAEIQAAISALVAGRAVVVIAHRLHTVMGADKIVVMENGRIVEEGSSEALLARDGLFARLYRIQQKSLGWRMGR
ncbi:MAG: ABC transporter ATP-binding protein/permease [Treponema sp.]|jgi:ATP-binding cassette subfamily B protein|nr:ABC transporter ATP-binding protein/permease [Treponema sp.]